MGNEETSVNSEAQDSFYAFVMKGIQEGRTQAALVEELVKQDMEKRSAEELVGKVYGQLAVAIDEEIERTRFIYTGLGSLLFPLLGGFLAAVIGGAVWGLTTYWSEREFGLIAWGIGVLCGYAVLFSSKGKKGVPLQFMAVLSSILGILLGKYIAFYFFLKKAVEEDSGAEAVAEISLLSGKVMSFFMEKFFSMLGGFDVLFVMFAIYSAWKITRALNIKMPQQAQ